MEDFAHPYKSEEDGCYYDREGRLLFHQTEDYPKEGNSNIHKYRAALKQAREKKLERESDKSTNGLTKAIRAHLKTLGMPSFRINVMGVYNKETGKYMKSNATLGMPDILTIYNGVFIGIEVKFGRDSQKDKQKERQEEIEAAGGYYIIAKEFEQLKTDLKNLINMPKFVNKKGGKSALFSIDDMKTTEK